MRDVHTVTGAFGYSGKYIAQMLLDNGLTVETLTNSLRRENPFGTRVLAHPFSFNDPARLKEALARTAVLYNTYWVRFNHGDFSHDQGVQNTLALFEAAKKAGVERIVHVSITNPSMDSPFEYFRGKAVLEKHLVESGLSYAILRPAVLFGGVDILINNIAWFLRRFPFFGVFGKGDYRVRPIHVKDMAGLAVEQGAKQGNGIIEAVGPESFSYRDMIRAIGKSIGKNRPILRIPAVMGLFAGMVLGKILKDVVITREEIGALMAGLLDVEAPAAGETRLTQWAEQHAHELGLRYHGELIRRKNRKDSYETLTGSTY